MKAYPFTAACVTHTAKKCAAKPWMVQSILPDSQSSDKPPLFRPWWLAVQEGPPHSPFNFSINLLQLSLLCKLFYAFPFLRKERFHLWDVVVIMTIVKTEEVLQNCVLFKQNWRNQRRCFKLFFQKPSKVIENQYYFFSTSGFISGKRKRCVYSVVNALELPLLPATPLYLSH